MKYENTVWDKFACTHLTNQVLQFHEKMGIPIQSDGPKVPSNDRIRLRMRMKVEEFFETLRAVYPNHISMTRTEMFVSDIVEFGVIRVNLPQLVDGICDQAYINEGTLIEFGVNPYPIAEAIHQANMRKVGGPMREDGKQLKPDGWKPADVAALLVEQGWKPE